MRGIPSLSELLATNPRSSNVAPALSAQRHFLRSFRSQPHRVHGSSAKTRWGKNPDDEKADDWHPQPNPILKSRLPSTDERSEYPYHHQRAQRLEEIPWVYRITWAIRHQPKRGWRRSAPRSRHDDKVE